jgi:A/G-specific adenine glycosylase
LVTANAAMLLCQHYVDNFRRLPWRSPPGEPAPDPYRVWLSEIMLQQTTVAAVTGRFERFVARWPTIEALAAARDEEVLAEWAGLGYYARARNLIACAREVVLRGGFPKTSGQLIELPGLGAYTAAAIGAIAFGERAAVVDTNVARVIARLHALENPSLGQVRDLMLAMTPADRPGDFVQAMMDLGATICRPKAPNCPACPLRIHCAGLSTGTPDAFPAAKAKQVRPLRHGTAWWSERDGKVWLVRRPPTGLLGGMTALPGSDWSTKPGRASRARLGTVRHVFTHFALDLHIEHRRDPPEEGWWHPLDRLGDAGLPSLYRRAAQLALGRAAALDEARPAP